MAFTVMIAPVAPTGCPSEMPEPLGLTLAGSRSSSRMTAQACAAKASLASMTSMSCARKPARCSALRVAADAIALGHVLRRDAHVHLAERVVQDAGHVVVQLGVAHANAPPPGRHQVGAAAHGFRPGADGDFAIARGNRLSSADDGLQ